MSSHTMDAPQGRIKARSLFTEPAKEKPGL